VPPGEWDAFIEALRAPLPTTIRINGSGRHAAELRRRLEGDFFANFGEGPIYVRGGGGRFSVQRQR
jgi:16S rRNA C967 or C1407 C5-methylase (RsmB/RsmF family)